MFRRRIGSREREVRGRRRRYACRISRRVILPGVSSAGRGVRGCLELAPNYDHRQLRQYRTYETRRVIVIAARENPCLRLQK